MLVTNISIVPIIFDHESPQIRYIFGLLQNHHSVCLLSWLCRTKYRGNLKIIVIVNLLRVNDEKNMHVSFRCQGSQSANNLILEVEFACSICLIAQHELQVINADDLNIVIVDGMIQCYHYLSHVRRTIVVQIMQRELRKFLYGTLNYIQI